MAPPFSFHLNVDEALFTEREDHLTRNWVFELIQYIDLVKYYSEDAHILIRYLHTYERDLEEYNVSYGDFFEYKTGTVWDANAKEMRLDGHLVSPTMLMLMKRTYPLIRFQTFIANLTCQLELIQRETGRTLTYKFSAGTSGQIEAKLKERFLRVMTVRDKTLVTLFLAMRTRSRMPTPKLWKMLEDVIDSVALCMWNQLKVALEVTLPPISNHSYQKEIICISRYALDGFDFSSVSNTNFNTWVKGLGSEMCRHVIATASALPPLQANLLYSYILPLSSFLYNWAALLPLIVHPRVRIYTSPLQAIYRAVDHVAEYEVYSETSMLAHRNRFAKTEAIIYKEVVYGGSGLIVCSGGASYISQYLAPNLAASMSYIKRCREVNVKPFKVRMWHTPIRLFAIVENEGWAAAYDEVTERRIQAFQHPRGSFSFTYFESDEWIDIAFDLFTNTPCGGRVAEMVPVDDDIWHLPMCDGCNAAFHLYNCSFLQHLLDSWIETYNPFEIPSDVYRVIGDGAGVDAAFKRVQLISVSPLDFVIFAVASFLYRHEVPPRFWELYGRRLIDPLAGVIAAPLLREISQTPPHFYTYVPSKSSPKKIKEIMYVLYHLWKKGEVLKMYPVTFL